jgi:ketosteroid isomerase-like protein
MRILSFASILPSAGLALFLGSCSIGAQISGGAKSSFQVRVLVIESTPSAARNNPQPEALLKAGGKVIFDQEGRAIDGEPAHFESMQGVSYSLHTGDKAKPTKTATIKVGLRGEIVTHLNSDGTIQLDLDLSNSVPALSGAPALTKQGLFDRRQLRDGSRVSFGTWTQAAKAITVFVTATKEPKSQEASATPDLYNEISHMDSVLFDAFNTRNLDKLKTLFTEDLEFYHDKHGLAFYEENMESFRNNFESPSKTRRVLEKGSLEVYPIKDYGAVEIGIHRFYTTDKGQPEKLTATAKFVHVWQKKNGEWKISRVISYDHK